MTEHLGRWEERATTAGEHRAVALLRAQAQFWLAADAETAWGTAQTALDAFAADQADESPMSADELLVNQAYMPITVSDPTAALDLAERFCTDERLHVRIRALRTAASAGLLAGRLRYSVERIDQAIAAQEALGSTNISALRVGMEVIKIDAYTFLGDIGAAERMSQRMLSEGSNDAAFAFGAAGLGLAWGFAGRPRAGLAMLESQAARWDLAPGVMQRRWLLPFRAWLQAAGGMWAEATATLREFDEDRGLGRTYDMLAEAARVQVLVHDGRLGDAEHRCRAAIDRFAAIGHRLAEAVCQYELVRLGITRTVDRLSTLAETCDSPLVTAWAVHGRALAGGSADGLARAAERFEELGLLVAAGEAATHATDAYRRATDQRMANRMLGRARELRARCEEAVPATPLLDTGPVALTRREREIAVLAAQGLASKEIGDRLFISRRTAENHLANVYDKLGVGTRAELARVLDGGFASLAA